MQNALKTRKKQHPIITKVPLDQEILNVDEVAFILGREPAWVTAHSNGNRQPTIPAEKIGKFWFYDQSTVRAFVRGEQPTKKGVVIEITTPKCNAA